MAKQRSINTALLPLAWIYGLILSIRNKLYDTGLLSSRKADIKTIVIGNISLGGTGKTPHVIWLAKMLSENYNVAILSRGYRRQTKGFRWVNIDDHPSNTGDEPLEMKSLLPDIPIAVDADRLNGIKRIKEESSMIPDYIILDDGFQHRKLKPDYAIILSDSENPGFNDRLVPAGRLREPLSSIKRANTIIITNDASGKESSDEKFKSSYNLKDSQDIFRSSFSYPSLAPLSESAESISAEEADSAIIVAGTANPRNLKELWDKKININLLAFPDHHNYTDSDIQMIISEYNKLEGKKKILITTGKDAVKLKLFPQICLLPMFSQEREIEMTEEHKRILLERITTHG